MGASNFAGLALPKPMSPQQVTRGLKRLLAKMHREVYTHVSERDGLRCRACGTYGGVDVHRHHLRGRKFTTAVDVCCVCDECHGLMHVRVGGILMKLYGNADQRTERGVLSGLTLETRENDGTWRVETGL